MKMSAITQVCMNVQDVDPNNAEAVKDVVNTFFQSINKIEDSDPMKWLRTLGDVINRFPKYCMSHRATIESIIVKSFDSNDYYYVIEVAKCSQAVQQVRPSQEKTATPKTSWQDQMILLCKAAHSLITVIFPNAVDMYNDVRNGKNKESSPNSLLQGALLNIHSTTGSQNKSENKTILQTRLRNIFCFIQAMLVEIYPVAKPVRPQIIMDVIVRALSVSGGSTKLGVDVSVVKIEALRILDALVACLGSNLIPFSPLVFRLLMQTFRWSSDNADQDFSKVRCTAYNSLTNWLNTLHIHRSATDSRTCWEDELTDHILKDTAPTEKVVELTMGPQPTKHMSKKAKRKLANARLLESSIASHMPGEKNKISKPEQTNDEIAIAALECAETFLLVCGRFLKPTTHKLLQERIIRECYNADKYSEERLILLLRVADATRKTVPTGVPPPTQHCLQLYSVLGNTAKGEISKFCTQALLDIRMHLHCSPPSLNFALEAPRENQTSTNKRKMVSEKNREALESLLGPDRMPALDNEEDIITIPDEPSSKKQRLGDETDKISVSSDSINSVEISDDSDIEEISVGETNGALHREKEVDPHSVETVAVVTSNENNSSVLVNDGTYDANESSIAEDNTNTPTEGVEPTILVNLTDSKDTSVDTQVTAQPELVQVNDQIKDIAMEEKISIEKAPIQTPLHVSTETIYAEEGPLSLEVAHDYPNTINVLKVDDEIIPSTNETDDGLITCGQVVQSSQDVNHERNSDDSDMRDGEVTEIRKVNGNISENDTIEAAAAISPDKNKESKFDETVPKDGLASIEDMMADFVDEVNENITVP